MALNEEVRPSRRAGYTLAELVVTLVCVSILLLLSVRALAGVARAATRIQERGSWLQAARVSRWVLSTELSAGGEGRDWRLNAPDSVRLRAFRGLALVCSTTSDSTFLVRVRSARSPDPDKDSVLAFRADGVWAVGRLASAATTAASACPDESAGEPQLWSVEGLPGSGGRDGAPVLLRLFESGSYHVGGARLRYRRGAGGAQPLTESVLRGARLFENPAGGVAAALEIDGPAGSTWTLPLASPR